MRKEEEEEEEERGVSSARRDKSKDVCLPPLVSPSTIAFPSPLLPRHLQLALYQGDQPP